MKPCGAYFAKEGATSSLMTPTVDRAACFVHRQLGQVLLHGLGGI